MGRFIMQNVTSPIVLAAVAGFCASMALSKLLAKKDTNGKKCEEDGVMEIIQKRRSIFPKQYSSKSVPREILEEMLEASRWAPTHKLTEPWEYIIFESVEARRQLGQFLADRYKQGCEASGKEFSQGKYDKKISNASKSSFVVAIICDNSLRKNPVVEEICSVAMSVQNMLLVATAHGIGAYWSSGSVHEKRTDSLLVNPDGLRTFLGFHDDKDSNDKLCLGWMFVGDYYGDDDKRGKKWPQGRRKEMAEQKLTWK